MPETAERKGTRINVTLSNKNYNELVTIARDRNITMSDFVRNAIRVYNYLQKQSADGKKVYVGKDDKLEMEVILP